MFEKASRLKLRFDYRGVATVEDLWDIPMVGLNKVFQGLNAELKVSKEESLLETRDTKDKVLELKVEIIKHIASVRQAEKEAIKNASKRKAKKEKLLEIIAKKQDQSLEQMSVEDLTKLVNEL